MNDDTALLRQYAEEGSETAFTELVRRHIDLVYTVALRRMGGDAHAAADVAQQVFTKLARQAARLSRHTVLSAWLHVATRNVAVDLMRSEKRRKAREVTAMSLQPAATAPADWEKIRPLLDAAVDELADADRAAVVLRFMLQQPFAEIGRALRVSEDAARMRTERALDKLRGLLARRGIDSTSAALAAVVTSQPLTAAPAELVATLSAHSLGLATIGGGLGDALGLLMTTKSIIGGAIAAAIGIGLGIFLRDQGIGGARANAAVSPVSSELAQQVASLQRSNQALREDTERMNAEIARLSAANGELAARANVATREPAVKRSPILGVGAQKWEQQGEIMGYLRQVDAARNQAIIEGKPASSVRDLVGAGGYIRAIRPVANEDYTELSMEKGKPLTVTMADGTVVTYDPSGATTTPIDYPPAIQEAKKLEEHLQALAQKGNATRQKAVEAYRVANQGKNPPPQNPQALLPYFPTPQDGADFVEFLEAQKAASEALKAATSKAL